MLRGGLAALALAAVIAACATHQPAPADPWRAANAFAPPPSPADNPLTPIKAELGRRLFYDADLSINGTISCATCHEQKRGFTDPNRVRAGVHGTPGRHNIQTLANVGYLTPLTWADPRQTTLELQAAIPIAGDDPVEMGMSDMTILAERLGGFACYRQMFAASFPEEQGAINGATIVKALAAFQRTLVSFDAPYDHYRRDGADVLSAQARRGDALFRERCASCHSGVNFTDAKLHRIAANSTAEGSARITRREGDRARDRTPGLRNAGVSAPYLHDGSAATLAAAIRAHDIAADLTDAQVSDLTALLESFTDEGFLTNPAFALPKPGCPL